MSDNWFYKIGNTQTGPVSSDAITLLIKEGQIKKETHLWDGENEWKPASQTTFGDQFIGPDNTNQQSAVSNDVANNGYLLLYTLAPLITFSISIVTGKVLPYAFAYLFLIFLYLDLKKLKKASIANLPSGWLGAILPPLYFYKRSKLFNRGQWPLVLWIIGVGLVISMPAQYGDNSPEYSQLKDSIEKNSARWMSEITETYTEQLELVALSGKIAYSDVKPTLNNLEDYFRDCTMENFSTAVDNRDYINLSKILDAATTDKNPPEDIEQTTKERLVKMQFGIPMKCMQEAVDTILKPKLS